MRSILAADYGTYAEMAILKLNVAVISSLYAGGEAIQVGIAFFSWPFDKAYGTLRHIMPNNSLNHKYDGDPFVVCLPVVWDKMKYHTHPENYHKLNDFLVILQISVLLGSNMEESYKHACRA